MRNILCLLFVVLCLLSLCGNGTATAARIHAVIIDPGHGGTDGGASGIGDIAEKHFNLSLSLKLRDIFVLSGYSVIMTRDTDDDTDGETGFNKKQDIHNREAIADNNPKLPYISIHMNYSLASRDKGFQVFYGSQNSESRVLAEAVHLYVENSGLANRMREVKAAPDTVYLMQNMVNPAILVECGFLGNDEDFALLSDAAYREKLALVLYAAADAYIYG